MTGTGSKVIHRQARKNLAPMSALLGAFILSAAPLHALPTSTTAPLARDFAYCAGRLSAEAQHREDRNLYDLKRAMQELLDAIIAPEEIPEYERLRIAGHAAQSELLAVSRFSFDPIEAMRARDLADESIRHCRAMLLGG